MKSKSNRKETKYQIKLPNGAIITLGPGTVPTSHAAPKNSIKKMIEAAREVSRLGIFDTDNEYGTHRSTTS